MTSIQPPDAIGGDLFWWRSGRGVRTLVTLVSELWSEVLDCDEIELCFALFGADGSVACEWRRVMRRSEVLFVDSRQVEVMVEEGVLAVFVRAPNARAERVAEYGRLYGTLDWISDGGDVITLHSDQAIVRESKRIALTEIVIEETESRESSLVLLNGPEARPAGSLRLSVTNAAGETREAVDPSAVPPFAVQRVYLARSFPDLAAFCAGAPATLEGVLDARRTFNRPYVLSEQRDDAGVVRTSAYHGGDRYEMKPLDAPLYRVLDAGESNPGAVWHDGDVTTVVDVLHSHGGLAEDRVVDAWLYDEEGRLIAEQRGFATAVRHRATRRRIADLLPDASKPFRGHLALRFARSDAGTYPGRLQMLMEYRSALGAARSMLWSDRWNSMPRSLARRRTYRACCRVFVGDPELESILAISNASVQLDYRDEARVRLVLRRGAETVGEKEVPIAPNATLFASIEEIFPTIDARGPLLVMVESAHDLASMQFTRHRTSRVLAAEHLMAIVEREGERLLTPCGA